MKQHFHTFTKTHSRCKCNLSTDVVKGTQTNKVQTAYLKFFFGKTDSLAH